MQFFVLIELPLVLDVFCYLYIFYYTFRSRTKEKQILFDPLRLETLSIIPYPSLYRYKYNRIFCVSRTNSQPDENYVNYAVFHDDSKYDFLIKFPNTIDILRNPSAHHKITCLPSSFQRESRNIFFFVSHLNFFL